MRSVTSVLFVLSLIVAPAAAQTLWLGADGLPAGTYLEGPGTDQFVLDEDGPARFEGDRPGSLRVTYDSTLPSTRMVLPIGRTLTWDVDFTVGAILTLDSDEFFADPDGFFQLGFGLIGSATTGFDRTGEPEDFRADTFDLVAFDYFPNVSPLFGGPFLGGSVFGSAVGDDAFANFSFSTVEAELELDRPYLVSLRYRAIDRRLTIRVFQLDAAGEPTPVPGTDTSVRVDFLLDSFVVDAFAISAFQDGFGIFTPSGQSLLAHVEYDAITVSSP